jgi:hypothetical protein
MVCAHRPLAFALRYLRCRPGTHLVILTAVTLAVACSVATQYGVKHLVDGLTGTSSEIVWQGFLALVIPVRSFTVSLRTSPCICAQRWCKRRQWRRVFAA